jgi:hypothetical protein
MSVYLTVGVNYPNGRKRFGSFNLPGLAAMNATGDFATSHGQPESSSWSIHSVQTVEAGTNYKPAMQHPAPEHPPMSSTYDSLRAKRNKILPLGSVEIDTGL